MTHPAVQEHKILCRLVELKYVTDELDKETEQLWGDFFAIADKKAGADLPYRFLDTELGMVLARTFSESAKVNADELRARLSETQWRQVSELIRVLDEAALDVAVRRGNVSALVVEECTLRKRSARRLLHHATKDELKAVAAA